MNLTSIVWLRRDLRLADNPALMRAAETGHPVIALFVLSPDFEKIGAAARWRLELSLEKLGQSLSDVGSRLILRQGEPAEVLDELIVGTKAKGVFWNRLYTRAECDRDAKIKASLKDRGLQAESFNASLLFEPWTVETEKGDPYKVYSPFWRAVRNRDVPNPQKAPSNLAAPDDWPASDTLRDWQLGADMQRGAAVVARHTKAGEAAAQKKLDEFLAERISGYKARRDCPAANATSEMSEYLTYGEISPRALWHGGRRAMEDGAAGAEHFLKEVVWREFAWHLMFHNPKMDRENWREGWDDFGWRGDNDQAEAWRRGMTGEPFVDAAMREMYVTGRMHNRARMIVASYLTKHLLTDWRVGLAWFADCLTDWDAASNAMGWQWVAGSGPDAAPYFRVFNPELQQQKFDPDNAYVDRWIAERHENPGKDALSYFSAVPASWKLDATTPYPDRIISLKDGRDRALQAYERSK